MTWQKNNSRTFGDGLNDNLRAFLVSTFERYEYQVTHTWVRKKQNWMVQRYNTATQMCRVIVNWMQSSLNYGCRDCYSAYARYKTVERDEVYGEIFEQAESFKKYR